MFGFINRVDKVIWRLRRDSSADVSSVSPSSERIRGKNHFLWQCKTRRFFFNDFN